MSLLFKKAVKVAAIGTAGVAAVLTAKQQIDNPDASTAPSKIFNKVTAGTVRFPNGSISNVIAPSSPRTPRM